MEIVSKPIGSWIFKNPSLKFWFSWVLHLVRWEITICMRARTPVPHIPHSVSCMNDASTHVVLQDKLLGSLHSIQCKQHTISSCYLLQTYPVSHIFWWCSRISWSWHACLHLQSSGKDISETKEQIVDHFVTLFWSVNTFFANLKNSN